MTWNLNSVSIHDVLVHSDGFNTVQRLEKIEIELFQPTLRAIFLIFSFYKQINDFCSPFGETLKFEISF